MITTQIMPKTSLRKITAKVELYQGSTLLGTFNYNDLLRSIDIDRVAEENKLFGFTVSQKAVIKVLRSDFDIAAENSIKIYFDNEQGFISPFPTLHIEKVEKNETTKEITMTAYCLLQKATKHTVSELSLGSYTALEFAETCAEFLGASGVSLVNIDADALSLYYEQGANFDGTETIREALTALGELTQSIIYFDYNDNLVIKRMKKQALDTFTMADYFNYTIKGEKQINKIAHITELGDNVEASNGLTEGITQYIRNNPFLELREDVSSILQSAVDNQLTNSYLLYELNARGNYLLEIGDSFIVVGREGSGWGYLVNDSIKYSGGLSQKLFFNYNDKTQTSSNPATLGETLKLTSAKVDKVNRQIELLASEQSQTSSKVASLDITTSGITAKVENLVKANESINGTMNDLTKKVEATMSAEDVRLEIKTELANGTSKVETSTGYTFNEEGLTVSKSNSEMKTTITDDGMTVYKNNKEVLKADNEGVKAIDLHATTFLVIGNNSRLEDYGTNRTACFWIGR